MGVLKDTRQLNLHIANFYSTSQAPCSEMARQTRHRIDEFKGSKDNYIIYLEEQLRCARQTLKQLQPISLPHPTIEQQRPPDRELQSPTPKQPNWRTKLSRFTNCIPKTEEGWITRRKETRMATEVDLIKSISVLTGRWTQAPHLSTTSTVDVSSLTIVSEYRQRTASLEQHSAWAEQISNFSTLLYICVCIVALWTGNKQEDIDADMRLFLAAKQAKCEAETRYLKRLRNGALWAIRQINNLISAGFKHRAWELFVICMSIATCILPPCQ